ncbi:benzoate/H(+) symporter BenE family transporter [Vibrio sp. WXL103]|uniref:benzoate/H(+) symporter BenE family transporter n=1 Tax=Vibrio sp. WXL103 TaxID=3450710 RepID=UPI003EC8F736
MGKLDHISAGFTAVLVGYTSAIIIVIQAATSLGANEGQIESWLLALGLVMGLSSVFLSWSFKLPILIAWSTPGAALLITFDGAYTLAQATPAFVITGLLIALTGLIKPLNQALSSIPTNLASAMLAAILLPFCINAFTPSMSSPEIFFCMFAAFLISKVYFPKYAMLAILVVGASVSALLGEFQVSKLAFTLASPQFMGWDWDLGAVINISLPLYVITMLSQNLPGFAMLKNFQYQPPTKPILVTTGLANSLFAPIGGFSVNLAAITAAICMNESVDPKPERRYHASISAGLFYLVAGLWGTTVVSLFLALPSAVTTVLAGFALLGTLSMCLKKSLAEGDNDAAMLTLLITLSGVNLFGIDATLWGLVAGLVWIKIKRYQQASLVKHPAKQPG